MRKLLMLAAGVSVASFAASTNAASLTAGDIVVGVGFSNQSTSPEFAEYTPGGTLVESLPITTSAGSAISGITVGANVQPYVYVGQFTPQLWTLNTSTGVSSTQTASGWATDGNIATGGLAAFNNYVYASSENNADSTGGVFRFNLSGGATQQLFDPNPLSPSGNTTYNKIAIGYNGQFYGLLGNGGYSSPYLVTADPISGNGFSQATLFESINAMAVDANGDVYVVRGNGSGEGIDELSPTHALLRSYNFSTNTLSGVPNTLELSPDGNILVSSTGGTVLVTTTAFSSYTTFSVSGLAPANSSVEYTASAFVQPPVSVPEPTAVAIAMSGVAMLSRRRRR